MRFFDGLDRTDYQDLLRAVGRECDQAGLRDLRVIETDTGLHLQFRYTEEVGEADTGFQIFRYTDAALLELLQGAYALRGSGIDEQQPSPSVGLPYQQILRALGRLLDQDGLRDFRFIEQPDGVLIQASSGVLRRGFRTYRLASTRLHELVAAMLSGTPASLGEYSA
jgi:hypothetical protein